MKQCRNCAEWKTFDEFYNDKRNVDGKYKICKSCYRAYSRERHKLPHVHAKHAARHLDQQANDPEYRLKHKRYGAKFYASVNGRARSLFNNARKSDPTREFDLTLEWIIEKIEAGFCPITGFPFDLSNFYQQIMGRTKSPYAPSLDRINPKRGYIQSNTRVVIWQFNLMKGEISDLELRAICTAVLSR